MTTPTMEEDAAKQAGQSMAHPDVYGKTAGLKQSQIQLLTKLYEQRTLPTTLVSPHLAMDLVDAAKQIGRFVGVLINRKGLVTNAILGDQTRLYLPDIGRLRAGAKRLRGLRLVVAKPASKRSATNTLHSDLVLDLERLQLDSVIQIESTPAGQIQHAIWGYLSTQIDSKRHEELRYKHLEDCTIDVLSVIQDIEHHLGKPAKSQPKTRHLSKDCAVLIGVYTTPRKVWQHSIEELRQLAQTAGVQIVDTAIQQRSNLDPRTIVGKGRLEEICLDALHKGAEMLIFDLDLSPSQLNTITDLTDLKILDRTMLILDIFAKRATTRSGQAQVELAQLQYSLPRLAKKQTGLSRLTGGIGGQGPGETKLEIDKRRVKDKIARLQKEIDSLKQQRQLRRKQRKENKVPIVAIVGYTNAGKSTLLNALTGANAYVENQLFATLDPMSRRLRFPKEREVVFTDTVGFIRDLPQGLVNAFRATLEELHDADLLLHLVDITDPDFERHIKVVYGILDQIGVDAPHILVFNKCDTAKKNVCGFQSKIFFGNSHFFYTKNQL